MVADSAKLNPFQTETFCWVDIGVFRYHEWLPAFRGFPDNRKFNKSKVSFLQVYPFTEKEKNDNLMKVDHRFQLVARIGGGHFAGAAAALFTFRDVFRDMIDEEYAVQMVDLVLEAGCQQPACLDLLGAALTVEKADFDR